MGNPLRRWYEASPRLRRLVRRVRNAAVSALAQFALWAVGRLSLEQALRVAEVGGGLLYLILRTPRRVALENLQRAFGDGLAPAAREHLARASFMNIARCFCELATIDEIRARREEYFEVDGWERVTAALAAGDGLIAVTGHVGNWELLAAYFGWRGLPVATIARRIYAPRLNQLIVDFRSRQGVESILRESPHATGQLLRVLERNAVLAMVIDPDTHAPAVSVPLFGRQARTPVAASLAIRKNLPALVVSIQRRGDGGHRITVGPPVAFARSGDTAADIRTLARELNVALEAQMRRNPAEGAWWRGERAPLPHLDLDSVFPYTADNVIPPGGE